MTRYSNLFVAAALAVLPISAFAQQTTTPQTATPAKTAEPANTTQGSAMGVTKATAGDKTAATTQPVKPDVKTATPTAKTQVHGMNTMSGPHQPKAGAPAKTAEPAKS
jgi:hypothetical protein